MKVNKEKKMNTKKKILLKLGKLMSWKLYMLSRSSGGKSNSETIF